jgi:hypothetical protein
MTTPPVPARPDRLGLLGAGSFALGGAAAGVVLALGRYCLKLWQPEAPVEDFLLYFSLIATLGFTLMGAIGGAGLGLSRRDGRRSLPLAGAVGFALSGLVGVALVFAMGGGANHRMGPDVTSVIPAFVHPVEAGVAGPPDAEGHAGGGGLSGYFGLALLYGLTFGLRGAVAGAVLGRVVPGRQSARALAITGWLGFTLAGAVGFGVCQLAAPLLHLGFAGEVAAHAVWLGSTAAVGGAVLGGVLKRLWPPS